MVVCVYNPNTQEVGTGESCVQDQSELHSKTLPRFFFSQTRRSAKYYYISNFGHVAKAAS